MSNNFTEQYQKIDIDLKVDFLTKLLEKDTDLQEQFLQFVQGNRLDEIAGVQIEEVSEEICDRLSKIDIEVEMEDYCGHHRGHFYYDDNFSDKAEEILTNVMHPFYDQALYYLHRGNSLDGTRTILGMYELPLVELPYIDDDAFFVFGDDLEGHVADKANHYFKKFSIEISKTVISFDDKKRLTNLLIERYMQFLEAYPLEGVESFFLSIVDEPDIAEYVLEKLKESELVYESCIAPVLLTISNLTKNSELFLEVGEEFYLENREVALQLLAKYSETKNHEAFAKIAMNILEKKSDKAYASYIMENIDKERYPKVYIQALKNYIKSEHSILHYKKLREAIELSERLAFIQNFKIYPSFQANLLSMEGQYEEILNLAKTKKCSYEFPSIISLVIKIYPDDSFELIKACCEKGLSSEGRGRDTYQEMAKNLKLMLNIPEKREALKSYIWDRLYNHQPRLPALRDELNKAGLL